MYEKDMSELLKMDAAALRAKLEAMSTEDLRELALTVAKELQKKG